MCMSTCACVGGFAWELLYVLHTKRARMFTCLLMEVGGKVQGWSVCSMGSVARATAWEFLVVALHVMCHLLRKLTKQWEGGEAGRSTGMDVLWKYEISLFRWVDILQGTSAYSGRIHGAPLRLRFLLQVVFQYRFLSVCIETRVDILGEIVNLSNGTYLSRYALPRR